jgi:hypothetical protein
MTGLRSRGLSEDEIINILKAMKLIFYIDSRVPNNDVDDYEKSMETLIQYFIRGVSSANGAKLDFFVILFTLFLAF